MQLRFQHVSLTALGTALPSLEIPSLEIEKRLAPLYERLHLNEGRLETFTGIRSRRHFEKGVLPSDISVSAAEDLFSRFPEQRNKVQCIIHASVCRDFIEPATAAIVHQKLKLPSSCLLFDLSNACLSWLNGLFLASSLIESGQIKTALVVSGEDARSIVDKTIENLNQDTTINRQSLKPSFASLTLGSGGVAALLTRDTGGARFLGGANQVATDFHSLCQSVSGTSMQTDSEKMLIEGIALGARTWQETREALKWSPAEVKATVCHQVGSAHRRLMIEKLELDSEKDFTTFENLGNVGASSIGLTLALMSKSKNLQPGDKIALLGIGSGLVCGMAGIEWNNGIL